MILHQTKVGQKIATDVYASTAALNALRASRISNARPGSQSRYQPPALPLKSLPKLAFSSYQLGCLVTDDLQAFFERWNGLSPKLVPEVRCAGPTREDPQKALRASNGRG
jgi:hypothetical protein